MCGIAGIYSKTVSEPSLTLQQMIGVLAHRGPDAEGIYHNTYGRYQTVLGHRRLSIIDLSSSANQPFVSADQRYVIVFNGEIYNYKEVSEKYNIRARTTSDTEIIVEAYALAGEKIMSDLNGMFAFVIYDTIENSIFIGRDRMGVKPLYYYFDGGSFLFSSELKSIAQVDFLRSKLTLSTEAISKYLHLGYIPEPLSIYNEIKKFPAGSFGRLKEGVWRIESYWTLEAKIENKIYSNSKCAKEELRKLLFSSVEYRMISDVPLGVFLSGGIDSSTVAAIAARLKGNGLKTFTIGFNDSKFDESAHARNISSYLKTDHYELIINSKDILPYLEMVMDNFDEPFADASAIPTFLVSQLASKEVKVVLSGDGGDELFMGYGSYKWAERLHNPFLSVSRKFVKTLLSATPSSRYKRVAHLFDYHDPSTLKSHIFSQEQYYFSQKELEAELIIGHRETYLKDINQSVKVKRKLSAREEQALFDMKYYLKDNLMVKVDRASMLNSIEAREPLLDFRLIEFALNLDEKLKMNKGVSKFLLKEILFEIVPSQYFDRPKWGFGIPIVKWLRSDLRYLIETHLSETEIRKYGILDFDKIRYIVDHYLKGNDHLYNRLWIAIVLQRWLSKNYN